MFDKKNEVYIYQYTIMDEIISAPLESDIENILQLAYADYIEAIRIPLNILSSDNIIILSTKQLQQYFKQRNDDELISDLTKKIYESIFFICRIQPTRNQIEYCEDHIKKHINLYVDQRFGGE